MTQFHGNADFASQISPNMFISHEFSGIGTVGSKFCTRDKFGITLQLCPRLSFWRASSLSNPKNQPSLFSEKVFLLDFGFSFHKATKEMFNRMKWPEQ